MAMRLVFFPILLLSLQAYSQVAERPEYRVGDKWVVERFDLQKGEVSGAREWRITEISAASMTQELRNPASDTVVTQIKDLDGNTLESAGRKFQPNYTLYDFPLSVGKKWNGKASYPSLDGNGTVTEERTCEVLAFEDVVTKAGTFKAYKIKCDGAFRIGHIFVRRPLVGTSSSTNWFSPEARRSVKLEYWRTQPRGGWGERFVEEVVSFELQK
jgi:hypothetical protein